MNFMKQSHFNQSWQTQGGVQNEEEYEKEALTEIEMLFDLFHYI